MSIDYDKGCGTGVADRTDLFPEIGRSDDDEAGFVPLSGDADNIRRGIVDLDLEDDTDSSVDISEQYDILSSYDCIGTADDEADCGGYDGIQQAGEWSGLDYDGSPDDEMPLSDIHCTGRELINETGYEIVTEIKSDTCSDITSHNMPHSLDEIEQEIDRLKLRWSEVTYLIGQRLKYIADNRLYEQKGYNDFRTYVTLALKMSENNAYYYISVFEYFTEEQTKRAGSKLKLIIPVLNKLKRDKTVSDELKKIKIKGMRDELYYKIYNKTYREAEKIITDMRRKYFTDIGKIVQFQRVRIVKDKIIISEQDSDIRQKLVDLINEFYG